MKQSALFITAALAFFAYGSQAQNKKVVASPEEGLKAAVIQNLQNAYPSYKDIALQIWNYAELGYKEVKSSALLVETLRKEGFTLETGVADIPTAFVATYGSGQPVIGILAEFDALPFSARGGC